MATSICNINLHGLKPAIMMVMVQTAFAGVNIFYKLATNDGMSLNILVAYRFIFAAATVIPLALILERKSRPKLTWMVLFQSFLCGLFGGTLAQNLSVRSLALTSATFTSAMTNLTPAVTFIFAISFRLEKLGLGAVAGKAKVAGTLFGIGGAMLLTFYKGAEINIWSTNLDLLHGSQHHLASQQASSGKRVLGSLMAIGSCSSYAIWLIIQAKMSERYPCHYSSTALMSLMGTIQATVFALCTERDWSQWKLGWNIRLLTVTYAGIVASGMSITLIAWCVHMRGPLFVSVFSPLLLVLVALAGSLFLDEKLHLGSILGAVLIVTGLYVVLWGKGEEIKIMAQLASSKSSTECGPVEIVVTSSASHGEDINSNLDRNNNNLSITIAMNDHNRS